jgi:hypothetical protein
LVVGFVELMGAVMFELVPLVAFWPEEPFWAGAGPVPLVVWFLTSPPVWLVAFV